QRQCEALRRTGNRYFRKYRIDDATAEEIRKCCDQYLLGQIPAEKVLWAIECVKDYRSESRAVGKETAPLFDEGDTGDSKGSLVVDDVSSQELRSIQDKI